MMYVDGFLVPEHKDKIEEYRAMSEAALAVWMDHGALTAVEAMGDDVPDGVHTSFPAAVKLEPGEVAFFSFITYRDRAHRDAVSTAVMADPRLATAPTDVVDSRRMMWGGFMPIVTKGFA
jgi:uncharacterized protein YbaA (DUF1428 family)